MIFSLNFFYPVYSLFSRLDKFNRAGTIITVKCKSPGIFTSINECQVNEIQSSILSFTVFALMPCLMICMITPVFSEGVSGWWFNAVAVTGAIFTARTCLVLQ